ncbi:MAG: ATP-binding protein [Planctomycetota bacterium]
MTNIEDLGNTLENRSMSDLLPGRELPDTSITSLQAALLADDTGRTLFAAELPGSHALRAGRVVGQDWRELFSEFEEVEIESEAAPDTFFFIGGGADGSAYRVRKWPACAVAGTAGGSFLLIEAAGDPAAVDELIYRERMIALGQIAGGVAHEVNNPLTTVSGWLQIMLGETAKDDKRRAALELVSGEVGRIANIVHHLLSFGRRAPAEEGLVSLNSVLSDVLELMAYQIRSDNIQIVSSLSENLPLVTGDANQLKQVFLNIIVNARQAMLDGGVLTLTTRVTENGSVEVAIGDTGCGMNPEMTERIFEPFYTTKTEEGGSGIGLFLCQNIARDHGGTLTVSSRPGEGSTFILALRAAAAGDVPDAVGAEREVAGAS